MYGIFAYIWLICMVNVDKYTIHGWYGIFHPLYTANNQTFCSRKRHLEGPWSVQVMQYGHLPTICVGIELGTTRGIIEDKSKILPWKDPAGNVKSKVVVSAQLIFFSQIRLFPQEGVFSYINKLKPPSRRTLNKGYTKNSGEGLSYRHNGEKEGNVCCFEHCWKVRFFKIMDKKQLHFVGAVKTNYWPLIHKKHGIGFCLPQSEITQKLMITRELHIIEN